MHKIDTAAAILGGLVAQCPEPQMGIAEHRAKLARTAIEYADVLAAEVRRRDEIARPARTSAAGSEPGDDGSMLLKQQVRAARALLSWSQDDLGRRSGVSGPTIKRIEPGAGPIKASTEIINKIRSALERAGVDFVRRGADVGVVLCAPIEET